MDNQCFHGGAFWNSLDVQFRSKAGADRVINADVLDAWFPPSPIVIEALNRFSDWACNTSPPTYAEGLVEAISDTYEVHADEILVGGGSSALWFLFASVILSPVSQVLLIEPSYGEYAHVCSSVVGCSVTSLATSAAAGFTLDLSEWVSKLQESHYDLAVLINPNNPTGRAFTRAQMLDAIDRVPERTLVLVDEAYMDFWNPAQSLLGVKDLPPNVTVISSFSKRFALSGMRVAMMRTSLKPRFSKWTPPWAVSMSGQIAGCAALRDLAYYAARYRETHELRRGFRLELEKLGLRVSDSSANWLNIHVPDAQSLCSSLADEGYFVRNLGRTAPSLGNEWIRVAVKNHAANTRGLEILRRVLSKNDLPTPIPV